MTLTLELPPEKEALLRARAAARGLDESAYLLRLLDEDAVPTPIHNAATPEERLRAWEELKSRLDPNTPVLLDDRREVIYED